MNDDIRHTPTHDELDDLAVYALDAHDPDDATAIESYLLAQPGAAPPGAGAPRRRRRLRRGRNGRRRAAARPPRPGPDSRSGRPSRQAGRSAPRPSPPPSPFRRPSRSIGPSSSGACRTCGRPHARRLVRPVDPPEFAGWTVHDVVAHLAANATLLAHRSTCRSPASPRPPATTRPAPPPPRPATTAAAVGCDRRVAAAARRRRPAVAALEGGGTAPELAEDRLVGGPHADRLGAHGPGVRDVDAHRRHPPCARPPDATATAPALRTMTRPGLRADAAHAGGTGPAAARARSCGCGSPTSPTRVGRRPR